jgi:hypothetical protein
MTTETIYRVRVKTTGSVQPGYGATDWQSEVLYCGTDRTEARTVYHRNAPTDFGGSHGNQARRTLFEVIEDAETEDAADDPVSIGEAD